MRKILFAAVAALSPVLFGATLYVTPTGAGNKDGSSWANAFAGIQAAVDAADAAYVLQVSCGHHGGIASRHLSSRGGETEGYYRQEPRR